MRRIPVCLWFVTKSKKADNVRGFRNREGETLFIDARKMGSLVDRMHRELSADEIGEIARTYHGWRGVKGEGGSVKYEDRAGFCKSASLEEIRAHNYVLTQGRYVGAEPAPDDGIPFETKMKALTGTLYGQMREAEKLDAVIRKNLAVLGPG